MTTRTRDAESVAKALGGAAKSGAGWIARCPAHDDTTPSLSLTDGDNGKLLVKCHAGCSQGDVISALDQRGLWPERNAPSSDQKRLVATYDYRKADGSLAYQVLRYQPKTFRFRRPDPADPTRWIWNIKGADKVPYRLPQIMAADRRTPIWIVEGEKDAERLARCGLVATTSSTGAGKWPPEISAHFQGRTVFIIPDNDDSGRSHAEKVAGHLSGHAASIRIVELPNLPPKGDVSDFLDGGGRPEDLSRLSAEASEFDSRLPVSIGLQQDPRVAGFIDPIRSWVGRTPPDREWVIPGWIPRGTVTVLFGDGGTGKSLVAQQLVTSVTTGRPWFGLQAERMKTLVVSCEDDGDELHRRQIAINAAMDIDMEDIDGQFVWDRTGQENFLATYDLSGDVGATTDFYELLLAKCRSNGVQFVVIDTAADVFGGNENIRAHVNHFLKAVLGRLAKAIDGSVLLLAHPSVTGMATKSGLSGSTAWNAAVRSRLYLTRPETEPEEDADQDIRILERTKANYARAGDHLSVKWEEGAFVLDAPAFGLVASINRNRAEQAFLECLRALSRQNRDVSESRQSGNYAPRKMIDLPPAKGLTTTDLEKAMRSLFAQGAITMTDYGRGKRSKHIIEADHLEEHNQ